MADAKVNWYKEDVLLVLDGATDEILSALAQQIKGQARINIRDNGQVDTGFMMGTVYVIAPDKDDYQESSTGAALKNPDARMAPKVKLPHNAKAAVCAGAEYAIYQELTNSFLYRALEQVTNDAENVIKPIARTL